MRPTFSRRNLFPALWATPSPFGHSPCQGKKPLLASRTTPPVRGDNLSTPAIFIPQGAGLRESLPLCEDSRSIGASFPANPTPIDRVSSTEDGTSRFYRRSSARRDALLEPDTAIREENCPDVSGLPYGIGVRGCFRATKKRATSQSPFFLFELIKFIST